MDDIVAVMGVVVVGGGGEQRPLDIGLTLLSGDFGELWYRDIGFAEGRLAGLGIVAFLTRRLRLSLLSINKL